MLSLVNSQFDITRKNVKVENNMQNEHPDARKPDLLRSKLALETALIGWRELEVHYARGSVVQVSAELDLTEVGFQLTQDNRSQFQQWLDSGEIGTVADDDAHAWHQENTELWALVVAPWVLVQYCPKKPANARLQ